jgi:hypothetical protein
MSSGFGSTAQPIISISTKVRRRTPADLAALRISLFSSSSMTMRKASEGQVAFCFSSSERDETRKNGLTSRLAIRIADDDAHLRLIDDENAGLAAQRVIERDEDVAERVARVLDDDPLEQREK